MEVKNMQTKQVEITKELLSEVILEAMNVKRDIFVEVFEEAVENIAMDRAIASGLKTPNVSNRSSTVKAKIWKG
jgi:hypothetical protein